MIRALVLAEEPTCRWCGTVADCVDHIIPRKHGGTDDRANLAGSCTPCNLARGDRTPTAPPSRDW
ncbi:HNH endonuclease [Yinghuangia soli]|uniref:HNH endonuclease n=1 Tax=Yinghuangia soli TaxID=2908204 RepID=UPI0035565EA7